MHLKGLAGSICVYCICKKYTKYFVCCYVLVNKCFVSVFVKLFVWLFVLEIAISVYLCVFRLFVC